MLSFMWQLDNYLAVLLFIGFILYVIVTLIGMAVDKAIEWYDRTMKYIITKLKGKKHNA